MAKLAYQIVRNGANRWLIWRLSGVIKTDTGDAREYEEVARVVLDSGLYYVETPIWGVDGIADWSRQPRGWTLKDGAIASVTKEQRKALAS